MLVRPSPPSKRSQCFEPKPQPDKGWGLGGCKPPAPSLFPTWFTVGGAESMIKKGRGTWFPFAFASLLHSYYNPCAVTVNP